MSDRRGTETDGFWEDETHLWKTPEGVPIARRLPAGGWTQLRPQPRSHFLGLGAASSDAATAAREAEAAQALVPVLVDLAHEEALREDARRQWEAARRSDYEDLLRRTQSWTEPFGLLAWQAQRLAALLAYPAPFPERTAQ